MIQLIVNRFYSLTNERPDWMTDLKHTDSAWQNDACKIKEICYIYSFV